LNKLLNFRKVAATS